MYKRVAAFGLVVISGIAFATSDRASAQECFPFPWLCQRPAEPRYQPPPVDQNLPPYEPAPQYDPRRTDPRGYDPRGYEPRAYDPRVDRQYGAIYGPVTGEPFPVPAVPLSDVDPNYLRAAVSYASNEAPGTIIIDPQARYLYLVQGGGQAMRYGVGVGRQGFGWAGVANIRDKQAWPDWYPPKEMIQRQPELKRQLTTLRSGLGVAGGPGNPLGARAMYLWQGGKDTLYRIHGTNEPETIGRSVSSGCIRMLNQDVIDLYARTPMGAKVVVLRSRVS
jgi:lipoprotein-anchoring transpeptidase ErfK/SrfK